MVELCSAVLSKPKTQRCKSDIRRRVESAEEPATTTPLLWLQTGFSLSLSLYNIHLTSSPESGPSVQHHHRHSQTFIISSLWLLSIVFHPRKVVNVASLYLYHSFHSVHLCVGLLTLIYRILDKKAGKEAKTELRRLENEEESSWAPLYLPLDIFIERLLQIIVNIFSSFLLCF